MLILTIRTDKPEAEIGLYNNRARLAYITWEAHRQLAETLHLKIKDLLKGQDKDWHDIQGIAAYQGPGSFTGLRIGLSVANALAYSLKIPIVTAQEPAWMKKGIDRLINSQNDKIVVPEYGATVKTTKPRK